MSAVFWIAVGIGVLAVCFGSRKSTEGTFSGKKGSVFRINHTHYYDANEFECSACGKRFQKKSMVCPHCGAHFTGTRTDNTEYEEEMMEEEEWDEEEGS